MYNSDDMSQTTYYEINLIIKEYTFFFKNPYPSGKLNLENFMPEKILSIYSLEFVSNKKSQG